MSEPPVCVPKARGTMKSATAPPVPDDDPPGVWARLWDIAVALVDAGEAGADELFAGELLFLDQPGCFGGGEAAGGGFFVAVHGHTPAGMNLRRHSTGVPLKNLCHQKGIVTPP